MGCCDGFRRGVHRAAGTIGGGMRGLSRAALLSEVPGRAVLADRARRCFGEPGRSAPCEMLQFGLVCRACGCLAVAKVRVASEACPLGKWGVALPERPFAGQRPGRSLAPVRPPDM